MLAYWERDVSISTPRAENPPLISCLSWTGVNNNGKLGDSGWLALGNSLGQIGVISTSTVHHSKAIVASYNLQHIHDREIVFVKFNTQTGDLASCDERGILCVWSIVRKTWICKCKFDALDNEDSKVSDLIWSHKGLCLISHPGGVVSIFHPDTGRAATYPLGFGTGNSETRITISPCNGIIYVGTDQGVLKLVTLTGIASYRLRDVECSVVHMSCSQKHSLAIGFKDGVVILAMSENDEFFVYQELITSFESYCVEWSESTNYLAVLGVKQERTHLQLYCVDGVLLLNLAVPESVMTASQKKTLAITWGHNDKRVFVTDGIQVGVVRVVENALTNLMEISSINIYQNSSKDSIMASSTLPPSLKLMLSHFVTNTIYDPIGHSGDSASLKDFHTQVVPKAHGSIYCTVIHDAVEQFYTLYLEHMGSLVPLLEAHSVGHIRPKFVIYNRLSGKENTSEKILLGHVVSNVWGTKFKILTAGLHKKRLAKVQYKASLVHWLPRKLKVVVPNPDTQKCFTVDNTERQLISEDSMCTDEGNANAWVKMHNSYPQWNSHYHVYQLDCGGRVMVQSEKNFRFDYIGLQALQFGRISDNSYALDFGYPFCALQAFGVALTSVTHRLK